MTFMTIEGLWTHSGTMMKPYHLLLAICLCAVAPCLLQAQSADTLLFRTGPYIGYTSTFKRYAPGSVFERDRNYSWKSGFNVGARVDVLLPNVGFGVVRGIARIGYGSYPTAYTSGTDTISGAVVNSKGSTSYQQIDVLLAASFKPFESDFRVEIGPELGIPVQASMETRLEHIGSADAPAQAPEGATIERYPDGWALVYQYNDLKRDYGIRLGLNFAVGYEIAVQAACIIPRIELSLPLNNQERWGTSFYSVRAGVDVVLAL